MGKLHYDDETGEPVDDRHLIYLSTILCGTAMLLPYNAFIAVPPYIQKYYTYASGDADYVTTMPSTWANIENYVMVASLVPNFLGQVGMMTSWGRALRIYPRLILGIILMIFSVLVIIIVPLFKVHESVALATLIGATVVVNVAAAIFQASMFSFASMFPFTIIQGLMLGVGVSGSTASVMAAVIKAAMSDSFQANQSKADIYFGLAAFILFLAMVVLVILKRNPYAQHYCIEMRPEEYEEEDPLNVNDEEDTSGSPGYGTGGGSPALGESEEYPSLGAKTPSGLGGAMLKDKTTSALTTSESVMMYTDVPSVLKKVAHWIAAVFWTYFVSLFVFPSFGVKLGSNLGDEKGWFGVLVILMFNVGDFSGRLLCRFNALLLPAKVVIGGTIGRSVLVIMFFLQVPSYNIIQSVPVAYITMFLVGITNGYFSTQVMMLAPSTKGLQDDGERGVCGNAMSVALLGGAAAGSIASLAVVPQL